jgi:hypothetical protein
MKTSYRDAVTCFVMGRPYKGASACHSGGATLFSYSTAIAVRCNDGLFVINTTQYSRTTSKHQNKATAAIRNHSPELIIEVDNIPRGADRGDLLIAARTKVRKINDPHLDTNAVLKDLW